MTAFLLVGLATLLVGILFLIKPKSLIRASSLFNQIVDTDSKTLKYRITVGLIFLVLGIFFLFMAYYFYRVANLHTFPL